MRYLLTVNRTMRGKLPKDATPGQWARFNDAFQPCELTAAEIAAEIRAGHAIAAAHDGRRKRANWRAAQHIGIDLDDGTLSWDEVTEMPLVKYHAAIVHTTASHRPDHPRMRVLFLLEDAITDPDTYAYFVGCMLRAFDTADPLCSDPSRLFYGAPDCSLLLQPGNVLTSEDLANLVTAWHGDDDDMIDDAPPRDIGYKVQKPAAGGDIVLPGQLSPLRLERHTEALLDRIRHAPEGQKWETLRDISITLGGYVGGGYLTMHEAQLMLRAAIETRRATVDSMHAAYKTIDDSLAHGALSPLYYTRGDDRRGGAGQPARRDDLRRQLIAERVTELEGILAVTSKDAPDFANMIAEYDNLKTVAAMP